MLKGENSTMKRIVNLIRLKGKMAENGFNSVKLADKLNISHTTMSLKLNGKREFTDSEIYILATLFGSYVLNLEEKLS